MQRPVIFKTQVCLPFLLHDIHASVWPKNLLFSYPVFSNIKKACEAVLVQYYPDPAGESFTFDGVHLKFIAYRYLV